VQQHEAVPDAQINALADLSQIGSLRESYLKKMRSGISKLLIQPFLPDGMGEQRVNVLIGTIQAYLSAESPDVVRLYEEARANASAYLEQAERAFFLLAANKWSLY